MGSFSVMWMVGISKCKLFVSLYNFEFTRPLTIINSWFNSLIVELLEDVVFVIYVVSMLTHT